MIIITELEGNSKTGRNWIADLGFNIKKADWQKFGCSAQETFNEVTIKLLNTLPAENAVKMFNTKLDKCSKDSIPRRKVAEKTVGGGINS